MATYIRPTTVPEALAALAASPRTILAGGTDHYPARVIHEPGEDILDLSALAALRPITRHGATWRIPALATWTDIVRHPLPPLFGGLKQASAQIGGPQIQNAGTLLGNVCNASPAADGIPALLALDAAVELQSTRGARTLPLADFVLGPRRTAKAPNELATALLIPHTPARSVFHKLGARRYLVISITMVALTLEQDTAGRITRAAVAVGACGPVAARLPALEAALLGQYPDPALVTEAHLAPLTPIEDIRAPAGYRRKATLEIIRRLLGGVAQTEAQAA